MRQADALLDRSERFFGLADLGSNFEGSAIHQKLLQACDKLFVAASGGTRRHRWSAV